MKKCLLFIGISMSMLSYVYSQQNVDQRIVEAYDQSEIDQLLAYAPDRIEYLNFVLDSAWYIMEVDASKIEGIDQYPYLHKLDRKNKIVTQELLSEDNIGNFNFLLYNCPIRETRTYYRIKGGNRLLVVYSSSEITKKFNEYRG